MIFASHSYIISGHFRTSPSTSAQAKNVFVALDEAIQRIKADHRREIQSNEITHITLKLSELPEVYEFSETQYKELVRTGGKGTFTKLEEYSLLPVKDTLTHLYV